MVLPECIRVLKSFSMNYLDINYIVLPDALEKIENFAFSDSTISEEMELPNSISTLEPYSFADCSISTISLPFSWTPDKINWKRTDSKIIRRKKTPELIKRYSVSLLERKEFGSFRKMRVSENKPIRHRNGKVTQVRGIEIIDVGGSVYRRIRNGKVILCVTYENNRIVSVKSIAWNRQYENAVVYLMYPVLDEENGVMSWRDSFTYLDKDDIIGSFDSFDGSVLMEKGLLRLPFPDDTQEE